LGCLFFCANKWKWKVKMKKWKVNDQNRKVSQSNREENWKFIEKSTHKKYPIEVIGY